MAGLGRVRMLSELGRAAAAACLVWAAAASPQSGFVSSAEAAPSLGGFPIREPGGAANRSSGSVTRKDGKAMQIVVDANGVGPYRTISSALRDISDGGVVYVLHGTYKEALKLDKSVVIQGDRGPGEGVKILSPENEACLEFAPKNTSGHATVANVKFISASRPGGNACIEVERGVFALKESYVRGSGLTPSVKIMGGMAFLEKNRIMRGSAGVMISQDHSLSQSVIVDNSILANKVGIDVNGRSDIVVAGNDIYDNLESGIVSDGTGGATVIGNKIRNNKGNGVILHEKAKESLLRFNVIAKNGRDGVFIPLGADGLLEGNEIVNNGGKSIAYVSGVRPKVVNNVVEANGGDRRRRKAIFGYD